MKITKLEHSGIIIEKEDKQIIFDPVEFKEKIPELKNVVAIVITHKHGDHLQLEVIARIRSDFPLARIFTTSDATALIENVTLVKNGDSYNVDGFELDFFGKDHADIIPGQVPCENIGVVIDNKIVNPGDSFDIPNINAEVLFVAISAPWLKIAESMDYVKKAKPKTVIPVHNALLSELGELVNGNWMKEACKVVGAEYLELKPGSSIATN